MYLGRSSKLSLLQGKGLYVCTAFALEGHTGALRSDAAHSDHCTAHTHQPAVHTSSQHPQWSLRLVVVQPEKRSTWSVSQQRICECYGNWKNMFVRVRASPPCADVRDADDWFGHREVIFLQLCRLLLQINCQHLNCVHVLSQVFFLSLHKKHQFRESSFFSSLFLMLEGVD